MKSSRWGGNRTSLIIISKNCLVTADIIGSIRTIYILRQGYMTVEINYSDELDQPYITEDNRRYGQLAIVLRAQTLWDVDCWTRVLGEPLKPGDIHEAIRQKMPEGGAS